MDIILKNVGIIKDSTIKMDIFQSCSSTLVKK